MATPWRLLRRNRWGRHHGRQRAAARRYSETIRLDRSPLQYLLLEEQNHRLLQVQEAGWPRSSHHRPRTRQRFTGSAAPPAYPLIAALCGTPAYAPLQDIPVPRRTGPAHRRRPAQRASVPVTEASGKLVRAGPARPRGPRTFRGRPHGEPRPPVLWGLRCRTTLQDGTWRLRVAREVVLHLAGGRRQQQAVVCGTDCVACLALGGLAARDAMVEHHPNDPVHVDTT
mmetsp:Transcript_29578/g.70945  ORF Transcript_29578/g.70945 Transcript_29578/m.70945 type:complete len:227 (-) Transcript_29578:646-1326(-)